MHPKEVASLVPRAVAVEAPPGGEAEEKVVERGAPPVVIAGDLAVADGARWTLAAKCSGKAALGAGCRFEGGLAAGGAVSVGAGSRLTGGLASAGKIEWGRGAQAGGAVEGGPFLLEGRAIARRLLASEGVWAVEEAPDPEATR
jgi:predicted acyltransferase (DUF342 family)